MSPLRLTLEGDCFMLSDTCQAILDGAKNLSGREAAKIMLKLQGLKIFPA